MINLQRIDNSRFAFVLNETKQSVIIEIDTKLGDPEFRVNLAQKIARSISSGEKPKDFSLGNKKWSVKSASRTPFLLRAAKSVTSMVHHSDDDGVLRYKVSEIKSRPVAGIADAAIEQEANKSFAKKVDGINYTYVHGNDLITKEEYAQKMRGKETIPKGVLKIGEPLFSDPFTKLSSIAFQRLETEFNSKDYFPPEECDYCLVKKGNELILVNKNNSKINNPKDGKATVKFYKDYLMKEYGKEKVAYIEHLYGMNLDQAEMLTPEHVFRFNMGVNNIETQDASSLLSKCHHCLDAFNPFNEGIAEEDGENSLQQFLENSPAQFNQREIRGILALLNGEKSTVNDLREWLYNMAPLPENLESLRPDQLQTLMSVYQLTAEERKNALTGRMIFGFIKSGYTTAGGEEYKPWVDQQQLLQTMPRLQSCKDELSFQEKLSFVIAKNKLVREHPEEHFRVGAIIPGPTDRKGEQHFYKVTNYISNSYGIVSMTLEKVCDDPDIEPIKIYRSTASQKANYQSMESVLNDFFIVSSPGYKGLGLADPYEQEFYHDRSIPLWVGYLAVAQEERDADKACAQLTKANELLLQEFEQTHAPKDLKSIFKTNPFIEEVLLSDEVFWGPVKTEVESEMMSTVFDLLVYIRENKNLPPNAKKERELATRFLTELKKIPMEKQSKKFQHAAKHISEELHDNILTRTSAMSATLQRKKFDTQIFKELNRLQELTKDALASGNPTEARKHMDRWEKVLSKYADQRGESIAMKKDEGFSITGHSLGGACVQSNFTHYVTNQLRMPLPGKAISLFEFDAPAIEEDDNAAAKNLILENMEMLQRLQVKIRVTRRQEAGDIVPTAGKEHLFCASDLEEERLLDNSGVLLLDQAIRQRMPHAKTTAVAQAEFAHETQFDEGERQRTFLDNEPAGDYIETQYTAHIQKLFDHAGEVGVSKEEIARNKEHFKQHFKKLWRLKSYGGIATPKTLEAARTWPGVPTVAFRKLVKDAETEDVSIPYQDQTGVFAVFEQGVVSGKEQ